MHLNRREFLSTSGAALLGTAMGAGWADGATPAGMANLRLAWHRAPKSRLFDQVMLDGRPLVDPKEGVGLLDGFCRLLSEGQGGSETALECDHPKDQSGPLQVSLAHTLHRSGGSAKEDLLEATLTLHNVSAQPCEVLAGFLTGVRPGSDSTNQQVYVPLSASALGDPAGDNRRRLKDCRQAVGAEGFLCHYLEPVASDPRTSTTRAALLVPVLDVIAEAVPCRVALFGPSTDPAFFEAHQGRSARAWRMGRRVRLAAGQTQVLKAFLLVHSGEADTAWKAFHKFGHREDYPTIPWLREVRVHYYDFLSAAAGSGRRGDGYDLDLQHFKEFHVGLATQHGYYLSYGDFVHPDRKQWPAMPKDEAGHCLRSGCTKSP
jgi:hypothetical protein